MTPRRAVVLTALLSGAQFMVILDVSIIWIALPSIRADLHMSAAGMQWVVNAYTVVLAGTLLLAGRAGDLIGRRRIFLAGVVIFTVASLACGAAAGDAWLVTARAAQGLGGAILLPATLALLTTVFDDERQRNRAVGFWGSVGGVAGSIGFLLGGALTETLGWQAIFFINVPVGVAIALLGRRVLPPDPATPAPALRDLDLGGAILATAGLVALVSGIVRTETVGWAAAETVATLALAVVLLAAFWVAERRHPRPLLPPQLFRSRELVTANAAIMLFGGVRFGMWFLLALYMQDVLGWTPVETGAAFLPLLVLMSVGASQGGPLARRFGARATIIGSFATAAVGFCLLTTLDSHGSFLGDLLIPSIVLGLGLGASLVPLTLAGVHGAPAGDTGIASGLVTVSRQVGGALGVALLGTIALAAGYQRAFWFAAGFALLGAAIAAFLPGQPADEDVPAALAIEQVAT